MGDRWEIGGKVAIVVTIMVFIWGIFRFAVISIINRDILPNLQQIEKRINNIEGEMKGEIKGIKGEIKGLREIIPLLLISKKDIEGLKSSFPKLKRKHFERLKGYKTLL